MEIIKELGAEKVSKALDMLMKISPLDLSADKVKVVCSNYKEDQNSITETTYSPLGLKIKEGLSQYDRLREAMNPERKVAV